MVTLSRPKLSHSTERTMGQVRRKLQKHPVYSEDRNTCFKNNLLLLESSHCFPLVKQFLISLTSNRLNQLNNTICCLMTTSTSQLTDLILYFFEQCTWTSSGHCWKLIEPEHLYGDTSLVVLSCSHCTVASAITQAMTVFQIYKVCIWVQMWEHCSIKRRRYVNRTDFYCHCIESTTKLWEDSYEFCWIYCGQSVCVRFAQKTIGLWNDV